MPEVVRALEQGIEVLEIGCGTGHSTNLMAQTYPRSHFTGYEFREATLDEGRSRAESLGLKQREIRQPGSQQKWTSPAHTT